MPLEMGLRAKFGFNNGASIAIGKAFAQKEKKGIGSGSSPKPDPTRVSPPQTRRSECVCFAWLCSASSLAGPPRGSGVNQAPTAGHVGALRATADGHDRRRPPPTYLEPMNERLTDVDRDGKRGMTEAWIGTQDQHE
ncbi:hypothetical protein NL676_034181 [Syzygium grande]|nr:hypothetical protein NL676_034181 [Syzygium grande]